MPAPVSQHGHALECVTTACPECACVARCDPGAHDSCKKATTDAAKCRVPQVEPVRGQKLLAYRDHVVACCGWLPWRMRI